MKQQQYSTNSPAEDIIRYNDKMASIYNATERLFADVQPRNQILPDDLMWDLNFYINVLICSAMAVFGTVNNAFNIAVFYHLGFRDSMSVCLFALALTDFVLSFVIVAMRSFPIWHLFFHVEGMNPMGILYVTLAWVADSLFLSSGWITTLLSLERCVCVTFPFKVKHIFTRNRAVVSVSIVHLINAGMLVPIYMTQRLEWIRVYAETANGTLATSSTRQQVIVFSENRAEVERYVEFMSVTLIPIPSQVIILGSVVWMVYGLTKSSQKRKSMTASKVDAHDGETKSNNKSDSSSMEAKTRRLVKVVLFLAVIFFICSIPRTFATYINRFNPEIHPTGRESNISMFPWQFARFFSVLNASVNFFVYLKINSSYQAKFRELFPCFFKN